MNGDGTQKYKEENMCLFFTENEAQRLYNGK